MTARRSSHRASAPRPGNADDRETTPDFVEALARGLDVIKAFGPGATSLTVSEAAARTALARPTARRLLMTLEELGYVTSRAGAYSLTARTLELGTAYVAARGRWDVARPHLVALVARTHESSSMSQLEGSDIIYRERASVPKIIALSVHVGTKFPATATAMGHVLLAEQSPEQLDDTLATPSASGIIPRVSLTRGELDACLSQVREQGWAMSDELLSFGIRSIAAAVRDGSGRTVAAVNVTTHAAETPVDRLVGDHLPPLLDAAAAIGQAWADLAVLPVVSPDADRW